MARWICIAILPASIGSACLGTNATAQEGVRRDDANSLAAHDALLQKARTGRIDLYFVGDSITRRWGAGDPEYQDLLAHWNACFYGWNAANFGWGGDTVGNILWRLQNGELDGVAPKVIVILAGTNDLVTTEPSHVTRTKVVQGIQAILDVCRQKAPRAIIVLTGIFPRGDEPRHSKTIEQINRDLSELADGDTIRYLNVNDHLTDGDGKLLEGMMNDGVHPTIKGYQVWADGLRPILLELLGAPSSDDFAPPPTANPKISE